MHEPNIHEQLEACRAGSDDLRELEMAKLAEAIQRDPTVQRQLTATQHLDAVIARSFGDVSVPSDLQSRLLAAARVNSELTNDEADPSAATVPNVRSKSVWSKRLIWTAASVVAASLVAVAWFSFLNPGNAITKDALVAQVQNWMAEKHTWNSDIGQERPYARPAHAPVHMSPTHWAAFNSPIDSRAVVYFDSRFGKHDAVYLFVVRTKQASQLPTAPPRQPDSDTRGWCIGTWTDGNGQVFVIAVRGDQQRYRGLLRSNAVA